MLLIWLNSNPQSFLSNSHESVNVKASLQGDPLPKNLVFRFKLITKEQAVLVVLIYPVMVGMIVGLSLIISTTLLRYNDD